MVPVFREEYFINGYRCDLEVDRQSARYYLVAIPEGEMAARAEALQKEFSLRYGIYREPYPPLHVTVAVIELPPAGLSRLRPKLAEIIKPFLPLQLIAQGESCFPEPYKSINISIKHTPELVQLSAAVINLVTGLGYNAVSFDGWDYHISLVNCNYAAREWSEEEFEDACRRLSQEKLSFSGTARRLELWEPLFPPLRVVTAFSSLGEMGENMEDRLQEQGDSSLGRFKGSQNSEDRRQD